MKSYRLMSARSLYAASILAVTPVAAFAQVMTVSQIPTIQKSPGVYEIVDRAAIETQKINWGQQSLQADREQYNRIVNESYKAFQDIMGRCNAASAGQKPWANCTGFRKLQQINAFTAKIKNADSKVNLTELAESINNYIAARTLFSEKIAAISVQQDVFANTQNGANAAAYKAGSINLARFTKVYQDAIAKLDAAAAQFTYRYNSGMGAKISVAGMGLEIPESHETPEYIRDQFAEIQSNMRLSYDQKESLGLMSREVSRQLFGYTQSAGWRGYWDNNRQKQDNGAWLKSLTEKARVLKYVRGVYCMQLGTPAIAIPQPRPGFMGMRTGAMLDYLKRGVSESQFRLVDKTEFDQVAIRDTLKRFDQLFVSIESQAGNRNATAGLKGMLHRVNSTVTWHNEVEAYLGIMGILRENMVDELDIIDGNCENVRQRYYARYVTFKDTAFDQVLNRYLLGIAPGANLDPTTSAFVEAGTVIKSKGSYYKKYLKLQKEHPALLLDEDRDDLR